MWASFVGLVAAGVLAFLATPPVRAAAAHWDILDKPDRHRKLHRRLVPLWGGLVIFVAIVGGLAAALAWTAAGREIFAYRQEVFGQRLPALLLAGAILAAVGLLDDRFRIPPKVKLLGHLSAAAVAVAAGFRVEEVILPFTQRTLVVWPWLGCGFSLLWLTFMTNAFNFIDGLDGLATGQAVIAGVGLALASLLLAAHGGNGDLIVRYQGALAALLAATTAGAALGFWYFNRPPASIFLGDAGSTLLGFTLALAALTATGHATSVWAPLVPLCLFGWPIADGLLALFRRLRGRQPMSKADYLHLHHRLLRSGFSSRPAVALILLVSLALMLIGLVLAWL